MDIQYGYEQHSLERLSSGLHQSPEEFLANIEDQLDSGEITEDDAVAIIQDFCKRS